MSTETAPQQAQQLASIFQKAYARAVALQRMDEQIGTLLDQRQKLEDEFREAQSEVNEECERMLRSASIAPSKILAHLADASAGENNAIGSNGRLPRTKPNGVRT
jgi:signal transduction histidine kinase